MVLLINLFSGIREIQPSNRRIGSGRILRANGDFNDKNDTTDSESGYGNSGGGFRGSRGTNNNDEKYERRSFGRDFDMGGGRENNNKEGRRNGRGFDRRKITENKELEEPEWYVNAVYTTYFLKLTISR